MADVIQSFLGAATDKRFQLLKDPAVSEAVRAYCGPAAFAELETMALGAGAHLAGQAINVIFVPGVMGSMLTSRSIGGVWWIDVLNRGHLDDLRLSSDGSEDLQPKNDVVPFAVDMTYEPFMRAVLGRNDFAHVSFPYDWRKAFSRNTAALKDLILKTSTDNRTRVHLVAHSMGGLMVRATLMEYERELAKAVGRIVFIGTPHYGAMAIGGYLKNHLWGFEMLALLGRYISRDTFRSLWGVLSLLPAPAGVYPGTRPGDPNPWTTPAGETAHYDHPCANFDLYVAESWGLDITQPQKQELQRVLDHVADFHSRLHAWHQTLDTDLADRMLMIAGVGYKALFRMIYRTRAFGLWSEMSKITNRVPGDPHRDSDGRVPLASALLGNITTRYVTGIHGGLPNIPAVYNDVFNWLNKQPLQHLAKTAKEAVNVHLADPTGGSTAPNLDGTARASGDDPGYWHDTDYSPLLDQIDSSLPARPAEFHRVRLL